MKCRELALAAQVAELRQGTSSRMNDSGIMISEARCMSYEFKLQLLLTASATACEIAFLCHHAPNPNIASHHLLSDYKCSCLIHRLLLPRPLPWLHKFAPHSEFIVTLRLQSQMLINDLSIHMPYDALVPLQSCLHPPHQLNVAGPVIRIDLHIPIHDVIQSSTVHSLQLRQTSIRYCIPSSEWKLALMQPSHIAPPSKPQSRVYQASHHQLQAPNIRSPSDAVVEQVRTSQLKGVVGVCPSCGSLGIIVEFITLDVLSISGNQQDSIE